jgi:hypothetical protein
MLNKRDTIVQQYNDPIALYKTTTERLDVTYKHIVLQKRAKVNKFFYTS